MSFPVEVTSVLTGATLGQLAYWRQTDLLVPEIERRPRALYSFRDLVALRTVVHLRRVNSLQAVRRAFRELERMDLTAHPATYSLASRGRSIVLLHEDGGQTDLVRHPGDEVITNLADVFAPFETDRGRQVVDFRRPRHHIQVREHRMGGWPTIEGTRIPYDTIALLVADGTVPPERVSAYYPTVTPDAVSDAVSFADEVESARPARRVTA